MIGDQSSGKSTLLEQLVMLPVFPRAHRRCTLAPIHVRMRRSKDSVAQLSVQRRNDGNAKGLQGSKVTIQTSNPTHAACNGREGEVVCVDANGRCEVSVFRDDVSPGMRTSIYLPAADLVVTDCMRAESNAAATKPTRAFDRSIRSTDQVPCFDAFRASVKPRVARSDPPGQRLRIRAASHARGRERGKR